MTRKERMRAELRQLGKERGGLTGTSRVWWPDVRQQGDSREYWVIVTKKRTDVGSFIWGPAEFFVADEAISFWSSGYIERSGWGVWGRKRKNSRCFIRRKMLDMAHWPCQVRMENSPLDMKGSRSWVPVLVSIYIFHFQITWLVKTKEN